MPVRFALGGRAARLRSGLHRSATERASASRSLDTWRRAGELRAFTILIGTALCIVASPIAAAADPSAVPAAMLQFTTGIQDREPMDQVSFVSTGTPKIYLFSDLRGLTGQTVTHRWIFRGEVMAEVPFHVEGPRWRVWSSKQLRAGWTGDWIVEVVSEDGEVVEAESFTYSPDGL